MKKNMIFTILSILCLTATADAADWWNQPTVCKYNPNKCYTTMGAGFEPEEWDASADCRGMKYICPNALIEEHDEPTLVSREDINAKTIKSDYDTGVLGESGDCFGTRKSQGTQVMVNGDYVNLYCHGILDNPDEETTYGEIVYTNQPTCETLKAKGYIAVENGKCVGKYLDESKYYIQCGKGLLQPERIVLLNGAEITTTNTPTTTTQKAAETLFNTMYSASKKQKTQYFKK